MGKSLSLTIHIRKLAVKSALLHCAAAIGAIGLKVTTSIFLNIEKHIIEKKTSIRSKKELGFIGPHLVEKRQEESSKRED